MRYKFLVTGCSRSGTAYTAKLLSSLGVSCAHERSFNIYRVFDIGETIRHFAESRYQGDSSFLGAPLLGKLPKDTVVLHQLRDPISVIRSHMGIRFFAEPYRASMYLAANHLDFLAFMKSSCPEVFRGNELTRCMQYWVSWNRLIQAASQWDDVTYFRYRIEMLDNDVLQVLLSLLDDTRHSDLHEFAVSSISRSTNTRIRDESISWDTLPAGRVKESLEALAAEYGYQHPSPIHLDP